jgi:alpha-beta hydrolase superfamily lysophospholipase
MYNRSEGFLKGYQDIKLFFQVWDNPKAQGTVIITHGHGEHSDSYSRLIKSFENDSWSFFSWDLRGHGRSEGRRGYAPDFETYCEDFNLFLDMLLKDEKLKKGPVILLCHSMGGLILLRTILRNPKLKYDGIVASSPLLGLAMEVPKWKSGGASLLNKILPQATLGSEIENAMLTSDPDVIREFEQDTLRHTRMSPGVFLGMQKAWDFVRPRANEIHKPFLLLLPEQDLVCSTPVSEDFFQRIKSTQKEIYIYPNGKHELFNDLLRATVFADLKKFLDAFLLKPEVSKNEV